MGKAYIYIISIILLLTVSCSQKIDPFELIENGTITLTLQNSVPETRMPGVENLNENLIESIHYFFYPKDGTDTNTEKEPVLWKVITDLSVQSTHTVRLNVSEADLKEKLFKYPYNDCDVYVIVNLPQGDDDIKVKDLPDRKLSTLKALALESEFNNSLKQSSFVMEGLGVASVIDKRDVLAARGTILVDRLAAKISVSVIVEDSITTMDNQTSTNNQTWTSLPGEMLIEFVNGVSNTVLSGNPDDVQEFTYFNDGNRSRVFSSTDNNLWTCAPFYSYPSKWDIGSDEEPYLRITLPWESKIQTPINSEEPPIIQKEKCIYKVILGGERLERNTWSDLTIHIGILGNFENEEEIVLPVQSTEYFVADWSDGKAVQSEILSGRYLVIDNDSYNIYNENSLSIPFTTSHECELVSVSCTYPNYNTGTTQNNNDYELDIVDNHIVFTHVLDNNMMSEGFDFTTYTTKFTIRHKDNDNYSRTITVLQYPAISAEAQANSNWKGSNYSNDQNNSDNGYVYVNGYQGYTSNTRPSGVDFFLSAGGLYNNRSPHMYVFTITTTEGTDFIIGDPRDTEYTYDAGDAKWANAKSIYTGSNRELNYYYGTSVASSKYTNSTAQTGTIYANDQAAEAAEPTINMIAPKFRLASGYSVLYTNDESEILENLKKRCASYQEDGYPAGRWRLPTRAEFQFIMILVNKDILPELYYTDNTYWCAHGTGTPQDDGSVKMNYIGYATVDKGYSTRCVYDEWYWENSESYRLNDKDTFTWGDMPRSEFK